MVLSLRSVSLFGISLAFWGCTGEVNNPVVDDAVAKLDKLPLGDGDDDDTGAAAGDGPPAAVVVVAGDLKGIK